MSAPAKAYKLRPEFADTFVGGSVITGVACESMDLKAELDKAGQIITSDPVFQGILENYYGVRDGHNIRMFKVATIDPATGEHTHLPLEGDPEHATPAVQPPRPDLAIRAIKTVVNEAPVINPQAASGLESTDPAVVAAARAAEAQGAAGEPTQDLQSAPVVPVEHAESGYSGLSMAELDELCNERGLSVPFDASEAQLVALLEDHDDQEAGS